jgi:uncharacterized lipoprotein NlpE involved in copper resistance
MTDLILPSGLRPKIHSDLVALRRKIGGLKAEKKSGVMFPVKSAKDLMDKLRKAADELNMPMAGAPISIKFNDRATDKGTVVSCRTTIRFMSDDGSYVDCVGFGQGGDTQDKAGGKASTYAWKDGVVKALSLPDAEMVDTDDEQPFEDKQPVKEVERPLAKILKQFSDAATLADVETAKNEVKKYTWGPAERDQLQGALIKAKGRVSK